jgi:hypothetical protein
MVHPRIHVAKEADLPKSCLDATLAIIFKRKETFHSVLWGDGVIAARRRREGTIDYLRVECPKGAPDYLNYYTDAPRRQAYLEEIGQTKDVHVFEKGDHAIHQAPTLTGVLWSLNQDEYDIMAVLSDGVQSFQRPQNGALVSIPEES